MKLINGNSYKNSNTFNLLVCNVNNALTGLTINIPTIMIGNMEMEFPAIYIINKFMGTCQKKEY